MRAGRARSGPQIKAPCRCRNPSKGASVLGCSPCRGHIPDRGWSSYHDRLRHVRTHRDLDHAQRWARCPVQAGLRPAQGSDFWDRDRPLGYHMSEQARVDARSRQPWLDYAGFGGPRRTELLTCCLQIRGCSVQPYPWLFILRMIASNRVETSHLYLRPSSDLATGDRTPARVETLMWRTAEPRRASAVSSKGACWRNSLGPLPALVRSSVPEERVAWIPRARRRASN